MGLFGSFFGRREAPPAWASSFDSGARVREFVAVVDRDLRRRGLRFEIGDGFVRLDGEAAPAGLSLSNIAQMCRRESVSKWEGLVALHFDQCLKTGPGETCALLADDRADFARIGPSLRLRLYPAGPWPKEVSLVTRLVADDLIAALVYDLPETIQMVSQDDVDRWKVDPEELFSRALEQTAHDGAVTGTVSTIGNARILSLVGGPYAATHSLFVESYFDEVGPHGTLVACPARAHVLAHAIHDETAFEAVGRMAAVAGGLHEEGDYPTTPSVYWRRDGYVERLETSVDGNEVTFATTAEFDEMMTALARN